MMETADPQTGGLPFDFDLMLPTKPDDPDMRESASVWLFEENGAFGFPRIGLEAQGAVWETHRFDTNFAFPGGRVLRESARAPSLPAIGPDGKASVLGAEGLQFRCIEPFRTWAVSFDSEVYEGRVEEQIRSEFSVYADGDRSHGLESRKRIPLSFDVELTVAAPPWVQDYRQEKLEGMSEKERVDAGLMGFGYRIEQVVRGEGVLRIDGQTRAFRVSGSRIHRQSVRPLGGVFRGHCWQSAVFPDGRAFGYIAYPPRPDGSTYNEGYVYQDGRMYPARASKIPFLRNIVPEGDDCSLELESELGTTRIAGSTTLCTFHIGNPGVNSLNNQQSGVCYTWDSVSAYGMIERSSPAELTRIQL